MVSISESKSDEFEAKDYKHTAHNVLRKLFKDDKSINVSVGYVSELKNYDGKDTVGLRFDVMDDFEAPAFCLDENGDKITIEDEFGIVSDKIIIMPVESFFFNFNVKKNDNGEFRISNASKIAPILIYSLKSSGDIPSDYNESNKFLGVNVTYEELFEALQNLELIIKSEEREFRQKYYVPVPV